MKQFQCTSCGLIVKKVDCDDIGNYYDYESIGLCEECFRALRTRRR